MRFWFKNKKLEALYTEEKGAHKYSPGVVDAFFEVMSSISGAEDERDLRNLKALRYKKLRGDRKRQRSIHLNDQFCLIVEREEDNQGKYLLIIGIEDYH